jgi:hypothetical protein
MTRCRHTFSWRMARSAWNQGSSGGPAARANHKRLADKLETIRFFLPPSTWTLPDMSAAEALTSTAELGVRSELRVSNRGMLEERATKYKLLEASRSRARNCQVGVTRGQKCDKRSCVFCTTAESATRDMSDTTSNSHHSSLQLLGSLLQFVLSIRGMGKSIRSKKMKMWRALRREKLSDFERKRLEDLNGKLRDIIDAGTMHTGAFDCGTGCLLTYGCRRSGQAGV